MPSVQGNGRAATDVRRQQCSERRVRFNAGSGEAAIGGSFLTQGDQRLSGRLRQTVVNRIPPRIALHEGVLVGLKLRVVVELPGRNLHER